MPTNPFSPVQINVESPARGSNVQDPVTFFAQRFSLEWAWGLQASEALIDWVSTSSVDLVALAQMEISVGGHTFYGINHGVVRTISTSAGRVVTQRFVDSREFLAWDPVFGSFNRRDDKIVNGKFVRRYWHILPANYLSGTKTYTTTPYTGAQILEFLFGAPTVQSPWVRVYNGLLNNPVYEFNCEGKTLGSAVVEVSERLGAVFTLMGGRYRLEWVRKGFGSLGFPTNSDDRSTGESLSANFSRVYVVGGKNLYQVMNLDLIADWLPAWVQFCEFTKFVNDIFNNESLEKTITTPTRTIPAGTRYNAIADDPDFLVGDMLARERAERLTVSEYADLRDIRLAGSGEQFRDKRKINSRSRMSMPVELYTDQVLFRAFRLPDNFTIKNHAGLSVPLTSLEIIERSLADVTHDPTTGEMTYETDELTPATGYAIVQGCHALSGDTIRSLRPENFKIDEWRDLQSIWSHVSFKVDNSEAGDQFIVLDEPVFRSTDFFNEVQRASVTQRYAAIRYDAALNTPAVKAALTFAAERFQLIQGTGTKDGVEIVQGLNSEFVCNTASGGVTQELPYADGVLATTKAATIAASVLANQLYYLSGGYKVQGSNGTQLTSLIDRVQVTYDPSNGLNEVVDFTNERSKNYFEPERDFDRRAQIENLLPGERELRETAKDELRTAIYLRREPKAAFRIIRAFHERYGNSRLFTVRLQGGSGALLAVGVPFFREASAKRAVLPAASGGLSAPVFEGVTAVQNVLDNGLVPVVDEGIAPMWVLGPVDANDTVGFSSGNDYLEVDGDPAVGKALEQIDFDNVTLIRVRIGAGGGAAPQAIAPRWG